MVQRSRQIIVAGGGIAGLTAGIALARQGFPVRLFERPAQRVATGAGLQISPNATRLLDRLGVLAPLRGVAVQPEAVSLRDAATLAEIGRVPLGEAAERRWGASYLVAHRADLHAALAARAAQTPGLDIEHGVAVWDAAFHSYGCTVSVDRNGRVEEHGAALLVAADGVWSPLRQALFGTASRFSGRVAWRAMLRDGQAAASLCIGAELVTTFVHPAAHLVAYPVRGGEAVNLVAITRAAAPEPGWSASTSIEPLRIALAGAAPALRALIEGEAPWTAWPIHRVDGKAPWVKPGGAVLIGDAAHAMTPFAAQGAAAAIEDGWTLAAVLALEPDDLPAALARYEALRRPRLRTMARRAAFNEFAWHASGIVAQVRNRVLDWRGPDRLAADLDGLYGYDAQAAVTDAP